jgi:hypothetical protein
MIVDKDNIILFIEPVNQVDKVPTNDQYTSFMEICLTLADENKKIGVVQDDGRFWKDVMTKGVHTCVCGYKSCPFDFEIYPGYYTNSLATHYLRDHRSEVPKVEIEKVERVMSLSYKDK